MRCQASSAGRPLIRICPRASSACSVTFTSMAPPSTLRLPTPVEARLAAHLDVAEFEVFAHRHVENEAARGGPAKSVGLHAHGLHVAERLMVEQLERGRGGTARLECDLRLLRIGTQVGNEVAAFAEVNLLT